MYYDEVKIDKANFYEIIDFLGFIGFDVGSVSR